MPTPTPLPTPTSGPWCTGSLVNAACPAVTSATGADPGGDGFTGVARAMGSAFGQLLQALLGFWGGPDPVGPLDRPGGLVALLGAYTTPMVATAATIGVMVAGTRMAMNSARAQEPARDLIRGLLILAVVAGGGAAIVQAVRGVLDDAAGTLLTQGLDGHPIGTRLQVLVDLPGIGLAPGLTFLLGLLGSISTLAQFLIMIFRGPVLALLTGLLPIAAATSMTGTGRTWLRRLVAWIAAFTLYKFVAGLIYAAAFVAVGDARQLTGVVTGIALITVAVAALPALIRLLGPVLEGIGTGAGTTLVEGAPATGAVSLTGRGRQGLAGGPPSDAGPQARPGLVPTGSALGVRPGGRRPELAAGAPSLPSTRSAIGSATDPPVGRTPTDRTPTGRTPTDRTPTDRTPTDRSGTEGTGWPR
jgi:hypothetical protein